MMGVHRISVLRLIFKYRRSASVAAIIGHHGHAVTAQTVRNRLRDAGLRCRRPYRGLILTTRHRQQRLQWARRHLRMIRADWAAVLFTDESRFNLYDNDDCLRAYREDDNCIIERNRHGGGSVMILGGISLNTKTQCVVVRGNMNALRYQNEILTPVCVPHLQNNGRIR